LTAQEHDRRHWCSSAEEARSRPLYGLNQTLTSPIGTSGAQELLAHSTRGES